MPVTTTLSLAADDLIKRQVALTSGPFGDSSEIRRRADQWYECQGLPAGSASATTLHPWAEYLAEQAALARSAGRVPSPVPDLRLAPFLSGFEVAGQDAEERHPQPFRRELEERLASPVDLELAADRPAIEEAVATLLGDVPIVGADALSFVRIVALTDDEQTVGITWTDLIGLVVIGRHVLADPAMAADSLFHEALHSKMATIERGLATPFLDEPQTRTQIAVPWRASTPALARWSTLRAFDAFHVYAHLTVLWAVRVLRARSRCPVRPGGDALDRLRRVCFRSAYLSAQLGYARLAHLDEERVKLWEWLDRIRIPAFGLSRAGRASLMTPSVTAGGAQE